ncbi:MAG: MBL fold metallo-hydrolase, partial [Bacteroidetes bacterium]|nr:MBL fold metallo-hydrolase [Bacteroidota bacterium]
TPATRRSSGLQLLEDLVRTFQAHEPVQIGGLRITAFPKFHDASDPHSFIVTGNNVQIGVFTDIGRSCEQLIHHFKGCHAAFLEANYDEEMLRNGRYPMVLKNRIRGGHGHLSNAQACALFMSHRPSFMTHLILAHLSKENNSPEIVADLFAAHAHDTEIVVASRVVETPLFRIGHADLPPLQYKPAPGARVQLRLF